MAAGHDISKGLCMCFRRQERMVNMARKTVEKNISYDDVRKKYYVNLDYGVVDGKRIKKTEVFQRKSDAKRRLTEFQHQKNNDDYVVPKEDTLGEWLDYWLENVVKAKNEITSGHSGGNAATSASTETCTVRWRFTAVKRGNGYQSRTWERTGSSRRRNRRPPIRSNAPVLTGVSAGNYIPHRLSGFRQQRQPSQRKGTDTAAMNAFMSAPLHTMVNGRFAGL